MPRAEQEYQRYSGAEARSARWHVLAELQEDEAAVFVSAIVEVNGTHPREVWFGRE